MEEIAAFWTKFSISYRFLNKNLYLFLGNPLTLIKSIPFLKGDIGNPLPSA